VGCSGGSGEGHGVRATTDMAPHEEHSQAILRHFNGDSLCILLRSTKTRRHTKKSQGR
jgi:hypothetical protein